MKTKAFTLIELIIVIAIIGLLSTVGLTSYSRVQLQSRVAKAQGELKEIASAIIRMSSHTSQLPMHMPASNCIGNDEIALDNCSAGLLCTDGDFPNWQGPYTESSLIDPWGQFYQFDSRYQCRQEIKGCEKVPNATVVRAIYSMGPDETGGYTADDIVRIMCDSTP